MTKYIYSKIGAICLSLFALSGCNNYLDVVPKGKQLLETVEDYSMLFNHEGSLTYGAGDINFFVDDVWGNPLVAYNGIDNPSVGANNMLYRSPLTSNRLELYKNGTGLYSSSFGRIQKISNIILSTVDNAKGSTADKEKIKAEAKALRAYNYFLLVNLYGKHYTSETANDLTIPLSTEFNMEAIAPQATVGEIYSAIEKDLNEAIPVLETATPRENAYHFNAAAAYALKAKVLLFKLDFAGAKAAALASYNLFSKENDFIFDLVRYHNEGMNYKVVASIPENLYFATSGVGGISPTLYKLFDAANDIRYKGFFSFDTQLTGANTTNPNTRGDKDFAPAYDVANTAGGKNYSYNFAGLRTTDVVLMLAELEARADNYPKAMEYLNMVRSKRILNYVAGAVPSTRQGAMTEVINERRKELLFGFNRWMDIRRLNTEPEYRVNTMTRTLPLNPNFTRFTEKLGTQTVTNSVAWDSYLWVIPVPYDEFDRYPGFKYNVPH